MLINLSKREKKFKNFTSDLSTLHVIHVVISAMVAQTSVLYTFMSHAPICHCIFSLPLNIS